MLGMPTPSSSSRQRACRHFSAAARNSFSRRPAHQQHSSSSSHGVHQQHQQFPQPVSSRDRFAPAPTATSALEQFPLPKYMDSQTLGRAAQVSQKENVSSAPLWDALFDQAEALLDRNLLEPKDLSLLLCSAFKLNPVQKRYRLGVGGVGGLLRDRLVERSKKDGQEEASVGGVGGKEPRSTSSSSSRSTTTSSSGTTSPEGRPTNCSSSTTTTSAALQKQQRAGELMYRFYRFFIQRLVYFNSSQIALILSAFGKISLFGSGASSSGASSSAASSGTGAGTGDSTTAARSTTTAARRSTAEVRYNEVEGEQNNSTSRPRPTNYATEDGDNVDQEILVRELRQRLGDFEQSTEITMLVNALVKLRIADASLWERLCCHVHSRLTIDAYHVRDLSVLAKAFADGWDLCKGQEDSASSANSTPSSESSKEEQTDTTDPQTARRDMLLRVRLGLIHMKLFQKFAYQARFTFEEATPLELARLVDAFGRTITTSTTSARKNDYKEAKQTLEESVNKVQEDLAVFAETCIQSCGARLVWQSPAELATVAYVFADILAFHRDVLQQELRGWEKREQEDIQVAEGTRLQEMTPSSPVQQEKNLVRARARVRLLRELHSQVRKYALTNMHLFALTDLQSLLVVWSRWDISVPLKDLRLFVQRAAVLLNTAIATDKSRYNVSARGGSVSSVKNSTAGTSVGSGSGKQQQSGGGSSTPTSSSEVKLTPSRRSQILNEAEELCKLLNSAALLFSRAKNEIKDDDQTDYGTTTSFSAFADAVLNRWLQHLEKCPEHLGNLADVDFLRLADSFTLLTTTSTATTSAFSSGSLASSSNLIVVDPQESLFNRCFFSGRNSNGSGVHNDEGETPEGCSIASRLAPLLERKLLGTNGKSLALRADLLLRTRYARHLEKARLDSRLDDVLHALEAPKEEAPREEDAA
ncbi:unnamed protein product [Amoebophrya sp. A25]|nr:unnamed protein product [Amoebophrya sp. A25]|eukprot:GSA25T00025843001.1